MTTLNFALEAQKYTVGRALLWGNCAGHFKKAFGGEALSGGRKFVHFLIAALELIPIVGQVASLFETIIVRCALKVGETKTGETKETEEMKKERLKISKQKLVEENNQVRKECPITLGDMNDPVLLLEDGKTYEKSEITKWFQENKTSPAKNNKIENPTFVDNKVVLDDEKVFRAPYYCKEMNGGVTAEKEEIEQWFKNQKDFDQIAIYPNDNLFNTKSFDENEEEAVNPGHPVILNK